LNPDENVRIASSGILVVNVLLVVRLFIHRFYYITASSDGFLTNLLISTKIAIDIAASGAINLKELSTILPARKFTDSNPCSGVS
jgi:hypothetical protein